MTVIIIQQGPIEVIGMDMPVYSGGTWLWARALVRI